MVLLVPAAPRRAAVASIVRALALAAALIPAGAALAADLTAADLSYLDAQYGVKQRTLALKALDADGRAKLHDLIDDPATRDNPKVRDDNVAEFMFNVLSCSDDASCAASVDPKLSAGRLIAYHSCDSCHLTGTSVAPSFFKMAESGPPDAARLATALGPDGQHQMSPIHLSPKDLDDLAAYIRSLR